MKIHRRWLQGGVLVKEDCFEDSYCINLFLESATVGQKVGPPDSGRTLVSKRFENGEWHTEISMPT